MAKYFRERPRDVPTWSLQTAQSRIIYHHHTSGPPCKKREKKRKKNTRKSQASITVPGYSHKEAT